MEMIIQNGKIFATGEEYHKYSTEERIVGEWVDGSTLYERTYSYSISSETSQEIATLDSNIVVKEIKGIIHNNGNDMTIPWIDASFFYNIYSTSAHKLTAIKKNAGDWTGQAVEITICYTKST